MNTKLEKMDYNADAAQGFGIFKNTSEWDVLENMSSINISCGFHAGDPKTIREVLLFAQKHNFQIGAHIGYPDIQGFGYRQVELSPEEIEATVLYQLGAVSSFASAYSLSVEHVRLHGAMYDKAASSPDFAIAVAQTVQKFDKWMLLYLPFGKSADAVENDTNITVVRELLLDKNYDSDGNYSAPDQPLSSDIMLNRIRTILHSSRIKLPNGDFLDVNCDSIHFDSKNLQTAQISAAAREIIEPSPVNYNKACAAGWSESLL